MHTILKYNYNKLALTYISCYIICIAIIYRASRVRNEAALTMLYNTLVLHYFTYCSEVWGRAYGTYLYPLNIKQKQIIKIIANI